MSYKSSFRPPLLPSPPNLGDPRIRKIILDEAESHIEKYKTSYRRFNKEIIYRHIIRMLYMGSARLEGDYGDESIVFWDPWRRYYHELDEELNNNMLLLMSSVKGIK